MITTETNCYQRYSTAFKLNEVLSGKTVADLHATEKMEAARKKRIAENRAFNCKVRCKRS